MQEILSQLSSLGLDPGSLTCDGKVHRFKTERSDHKKNGWYCGFMNYTSSGAQFFVVVAGNHATGETHTVQSNVNYSPKDQAEIKKQIAAARKRAEDDRAAAQEETALECGVEWEALQSGGALPGYLSGKGFDSLFGSKCKSEPFSGISAVVPMRDVHGKIWSLQRIQPDGRKFFKSGGRVQGCFHLIGEISEGQPIRIVEGFATGITVHLATSEAVVVAFQSGNLVSVAQALREKYSDREIIVCGDDDRWTKKPDGAAWNPGREAAEEAAKRVMGVAVFPQFKNYTEEKGGTDFDDLRQVEGIDAVAEQLKPIKAPKHYIIPLGYDGGDYFFISNVNPQVQRLSAGQMSASGLCRLQPLIYWESVYPSPRGGASWPEAADHLMQECHRRGIFSPDSVRGCGVWLDASRSVYHRGTQLSVEGAELPLHGLKNSAYIYELAKELPPLHPNPLSIEECETLLNVSAAIRWKRTESAMYYAGWLAIAGIGGALAWRPHVWITGPTGSGKSYVMENITHPLLKNISQYFRGQTTEAGIRQKCGSSTLPVIFDEFETSDEASSNRIRAILELARQASSASEGIVAKGTVAGTAIEFKPQFSMIVGSIIINLINEQDRNRFAVLELARSAAGNQNTQFDNLRKFVSEMDDQYGSRLFARMVGLAGTVRQSAKTLQRAIAEKHTMRTAQQYGALLAGYWALKSDLPITEAEAKSLCAAMDLSISAESTETSEEREVLNRILTKKIRVGSSDLSVSEMIEIARDAANPMMFEMKKSLERNGLKVDEEGLLVARDDHPELQAQIFRDTKWSKNWTSSLSRLPHTALKLSRISGITARQTLISWKNLE